mmetsp:Transcript_1663/g.3529  ORF Transcript_1663/g.3529 Transcript_1663/m.3529 type:complete len:134 (-) Transcript_1663:134-535(-)
MKNFSSNKIIAKSKFWNILKKTQKLKKKNGSIIVIEKLYERKNSFIKIFGIWCKVKIKNGFVNLFKEYRDFVKTGAVEQLYIELAGRFKTNPKDILILRVEKIHEIESTKNNIKQFLTKKLSYPMKQYFLKKL